MKILVATTYREIVGGVETYLRAVLPELQNAGHELALFIEQDILSIAGIDKNCPGLPIFTTIESALAWQPAVCYLHGLKDPDSEQALATRVPTVLFAHNYVGTCISGTKSHQRPDAQPCQRRLGLACLALYFPRACGGNNPVTMLKMYRRNRQHQAGLQQFHRVLTASRAMHDELIRNGVAPERLAVVPLFPAYVEPTSTPPEPRPFSNRLLFVGRITALKGWRHFVEAIPLAVKKLNRRFTTVIAGEGEDRAAFEREMKTRNLDATFLGWTAADPLAAEMRAADLLVVPSTWPEPFGLVGIEAGGFGLPAVAYKVGGIPDWLIPGESGELAPGEHPKANELADAIVQALTHADHWQHLRVGAWRNAQRFTAKNHMALLLPHLESARR